MVDSSHGAVILLSYSLAWGEYVPGILGRTQNPWILLAEPRKFMVIGVHMSHLMNFYQICCFDSIMKLKFRETRD